MGKYLQGWKGTEITYRTDGDDMLNHPFSRGENSPGREWWLRRLKYVCLHVKCYWRSEYSSPPRSVWKYDLLSSPISTLLSAEDSLSTSRTISMCQRFGDTEPSCNKANCQDCQGSFSISRTTPLSQKFGPLKFSTV
jgi:hypothetical protein